MSRVFDQLPPSDLTYDDYVRLPDDGRRYEIIDGELEVSPAPAPRHQRVSGNLLVLLHTYVQERGLGQIYHAPIDVILARHSIVQPDLVFVAARRESIITERAIEGPPDLTVETSRPGRIAETTSRRPISTPDTASGTTGSWIPWLERSRCTSPSAVPLVQVDDPMVGFDAAQSTAWSRHTKGRPWRTPRSSPTSPSTSAASGSRQHADAEFPCDTSLIMVVR